MQSDCCSLPCHPYVVTCPLQTSSCCTSILLRTLVTVAVFATVVGAACGGGPSLCSRSRSGWRVSDDHLGCYDASITSSSSSIDQVHSQYYYYWDSANYTPSRVRTMHFAERWRSEQTSVVPSTRTVVLYRQYLRLRGATEGSVL